MSTTFTTAEAAIHYGIAMAGCDPKETQVTPDDEIKVGSPLHAPNSEEERARASTQQAFRFHNKDGTEVAIVVEPFRDGYCSWAVSIESGVAFRF